MANFNPLFTNNFDLNGKKRSLKNIAVDILILKSLSVHRVDA